MYKLLTPCFIASVLLCACNSGAGTKSTSASGPANLPGVTSTTPPSTNNPPPVIKTTPIRPSLTTTTAPGLNPPHGQPGHRCDIAVGAPLNGQPSPSVTIPGNQPPNNITINPMPSRATMPANASGMRINPPHGQPGHRCDVQVGQPLPSTAP